MATTVKTETHAKAEPQGEEPLLTTPIVIEPVRGKKKKKRKYSKGTKGVQRLAQGVTDALYRSANSVAKADKTVSKRSKKSARKKRDGLVSDSLRNYSAGVSDGFKELGKAPNEIAKRIGTKRVRRTFKAFIPLVPFR
jgi:hypothetical protein